MDSVVIDTNPLVYIYSAVPELGKKYAFVLGNLTKKHILTDFLIGAYALQMQGQKIVTHDRGYYSTYFPELNIITSDFSGR